MKKSKVITGITLILIITSVLYNVGIITAQPEFWARMVSSNGWDTHSLGGLWHFDEGSGNVAADSSVNGNNGTVNGAVWVDGITGGALSFDGVDDYVNVTEAEVLRVLDDVTVEAWIKPNDVSGLNVVVAQGELDTTEENNWLYAILISDGRVGYYHEYGDISRVYIWTDSSVLSVGEWYELAVTRDATLKEAKIYVNETLVKSSSYSENPTGGSSSNFYVGGMNSQYSFDGIIDEVYIWDEVRPYEPLVGFWRFDEGSGNVAVDSSGYGNDGAISGTVWIDGKLGKALDFDGVDDYVDFGTDDSLKITDALTIELWINKKDLTTFERYLSNSINGSHYAYEVGVDSAEPNKWRFRLNNDAVTLKVPIGVSAGEWVHVAFVYDKDLVAENMKIYENGVLLGTADYNASLTNHGSLSTNRQEKTDGWANSIIDEVKIWNETRTAEQIKKDATPSPLVGFWRFDEGVGTTAHDSGEYHNDGRVFGATWACCGRYGKALDFDGLDDYVLVGDSYSLDVSSSITIEAWICPRTVDKDTQFIVGKHNHTDSQRGYALYLKNDIVYFALSADGTVNTVLTSATSIVANTWTHVVATSDGVTMKLFINGVQDPNTQTAPATINTHEHPLVIGAYLPGMSGFEFHFNGTIDEVKIWNEPRPPPPSPLVGFWRFDEGVGTTAHDSSEYGNNGTLLETFGGALDFDGVDDYVEVPDSDSLDISPNITIEAWICPRTVDKDTQFIVGKHNHTDSQRGYALYLKNYTVYFALSADGTVNTVLTSATSIVANTWTHVVATSDGVTMKLFINGVQDPNTQTAPATINTHDHPLIIGAYLPGMSGFEYHFNGTIDEVRISNVSRTSFDLKVAPSVDADTVALWHFNEETGNTAFDETLNNNDGIIYGATWLLAGPTWTTSGKHSGTLIFDGFDDYVEVPDSDSLDITGKITLEAWIYPHTMTLSQVIVAKYNHSGGNGAYYFGLGGYGYMNKILFALSPDGSQFVYMLSNTNITANAWTHVTGTSNGTHMSLYINGKEDNVRTYSPGVIHASTAPLRIGCYLPELGYPRFFDGLIDEVAVFNEARSVHNVATSSVTSWRTIVGEGVNCSIQLCVVVENHGEYTETFNVSLYYNSNSIENQTVSNLESKNFTILTFTWNTTDVAKGNYTIKAVADTVLGETDTGDNTKDDVTILVSCPGDVNGDHKVSVGDLVRTVNGVPSTPTINPERWDPNSDINGDGKVSTSDVVICVNCIPSGPW